jgi:stage IV sporulation protein FB
MRDPFTWSFPLGQLFGISIRIHLLLPLVMLGLIARAYFDDKATPGTWIDVAMLMGLLCVSVLLHEFGHCYAARRLDGEANEVLLWPLGGLARVDLPHSPRAHFLTAAAGPAVNLVICACCALAMAMLLDRPYRPAWNPLPSGWYPYRNVEGGVDLYVWGVETARDTHNLAAILLARLFYVNWILFLLNIVLVGFPMDGGRMLQSALWPTVGYRQATLYAVYAGFVCMVALLIACIAMNEVIPALLALFIYISCKQEWFVLETGGEDSLFGYDFSQGYTSLERDEAITAKPPQPNFVKRWLQRRADRKRQLEQEQQVAEEIRMDDLLDKIQRHGKESLTDEEHRFLKRVASRYRKKSPE